MRVFRPDDDFWWAIARQCEYATFFHTPLWHRLAVATFHNTLDISFAAELEGGVHVVFPLLYRGNRVLRIFGRITSTFAGCYGGPIADGPLGNGAWTELYKIAADRGRGIALTANPFATHRLPPLETLDIQIDSTHVLHLDAPFDVLYSKFSKGHRSSTSKGRRAGVSTRPAQTIEDYRSYYDVYEESLRRWGGSATSSYPWQLFANGYQLAREFPEDIVLWLAERGSRVLAGAWVFYWNGHAVYWHGASDDEGREMSATNVLLADIIADACNRNYRHFDFNPSGGHEGVAAFKRRFGTQRMPLSRGRTNGRAIWPKRRVSKTLRRQTTDSRVG